MTTPVLFEEKTTANGKRLGIATLNNEKALNALTMEMVILLLEKLQQWQSDDDLVAVWVDAAGEKAFCAGGDVQELYRSASQPEGAPRTEAENFFEQEYRLDYLLHTYSKPIVIWGHGIVMGGGLGIYAGCSHKIVTERSRMAMPEVTIALYPDVGGSYFLNKLPGKTGLFLSLTGASVNAADALYAGLADYIVPSEQKAAVIEQLLTQPWGGAGGSDNAGSSDNAQIVTDCLQNLQDTSILPEGNLESHADQVNALCDGSDIYQIADRISSLETNDKWLLKAKDALNHGSPLAVLWIHRQLELCRNLSLAEAFRTEMILSANLMRYPEFAEGIRALLVDKDRNPQWAYKTLADIPDGFIDQFFESPWPENPLKNL